MARVRTLDVKRLVRTRNGIGDPERNQEGNPVTRFVICINNESNPASLILGKVYRTLPDAAAETHNMLRIIDEDRSEPDGYLYPASMFAPIDLPEVTEPALLAGGDESTSALWNIESEKGRPMHQEIYERLVFVARHEDVVRYTNIAPLAGLNMDSEPDGVRIGELLGEISTSEHQQGRPLLSAVVIHRENNIPGPGFFRLARELGLYHGGDDFRFFIQELRRVHDYWRDH